MPRRQAFTEMDVQGWEPDAEECSSASSSSFDTPSSMILRRSKRRYPTCLPPTLSQHGSLASDLNALQRSTKSRVSSSRSAASAGNKVRPRTSTERKIARKLLDDPLYVPRPSNAFILFRNKFVFDHTSERGEEVRGKKRPRSGDGENMSLSKMAGIAWRSLTAKEKELWLSYAEAVAVQHKLKNPTYKFQPKRNNGRRSRQKDEAQLSNMEVDYSYQNSESTFTGPTQPNKLILPTVPPITALEIQTETRPHDPSIGSMPRSPSAPVFESKFDNPTHLSSQPLSSTPLESQHFYPTTYPRRTSSCPSSPIRDPVIHDSASHPTIPNNSSYVEFDGSDSDVYFPEFVDFSTFPSQAVPAELNGSTTHINKQIQLNEYEFVTDSSLCVDIHSLLPDIPAPESVHPRDRGLLGAVQTRQPLEVIATLWDQDKTMTETSKSMSGDISFAINGPDTNLPMSIPPPVLAFDSFPNPYNTFDSLDNFSTDPFQNFCGSDNTCHFTNNLTSGYNYVGEHGLFSDIDCTY